MRAYQIEAMINALNHQDESLRTKRHYVGHTARVDTLLDACALLNQVLTAALDATKKMDLELEKSVRQVMDD